MMLRKTDGQKTLFYTQDMDDSQMLEAFGYFEGWVSRRQLAEHFGRAVSPSFVKRLERLVGEGKLLKTKLDLPNHQVMFWYRRAQ